MPKDILTAVELVRHSFEGGWGLRVRVLLGFYRVYEVIPQVFHEGSGVSDSGAAGSSFRPFWWRIHCFRVSGDAVDGQNPA